MSEDETKSEQVKAPAYQFTAPTATVSKVAPILVVHALPGAGKSTLAASAKGPLFMFTENGQRDLKVPTIKDEPFASYEEFIAGIDHIGRGIKLNSDQFIDVQTLVIDTLDHLEKLVLTSVAMDCKKMAVVDGMSEDVVNSISTFADIPAKYNFDKWSMIVSKWQKLWGRIVKLQGMGITILGLCHSVTEQVDDPNVDEPYPRHSLALDRKRAQPYWVDQADAIGFIYYPIVRDDKGKSTVTKHPRLTFKRSANYQSKTNFGLGEYKLDDPENGFMSSIGSQIPFFKNN